MTCYRCGFVTGTKTSPNVDRHKKSTRKTCVCEPPRGVPFLGVLDCVLGHLITHQLFETCNGRALQYLFFFCVICVGPNPKKESHTTSMNISKFSFCLKSWKNENKSKTLFWGVFEYSGKYGPEMGSRTSQCLTRNEANNTVWVLENKFGSGKLSSRRNQR